MKIKVHHFEKKGAEKESCDDVFYMVHGEGKSMILLADGVTGGSCTKEAVYALAERIGNHIVVKPEEERWTEDTLKTVICNIIQDTLGELARRKQCDKKEFASTFLLVLFSEEEQEVWTAHVGDGALAALDEMGKLRILSYPHYGILKCYTYTTVNKNLYHLIRVRKRQNRGWIFGMTDGFMNEIMDDTDTVKKEYAIMITNKDWDGLIRCIREKDLEDDASFFAVCQEKG